MTEGATVAITVKPSVVAEFPAEMLTAIEASHILRDLPIPILIDGADISVEPIFGVCRNIWTAVIPNRHYKHQARDGFDFVKKLG